MASDTGPSVRSYRAVFELERRIYRIDRLRLNPGGVPLRGVAYLLGLIVLAAVAGALPLTAWALDWLPWYVRLAGGPALLAGLLALVRVDGRPFHRAAGALLRHALGPRYSTGFAACARPGACAAIAPLVQLADGSDPRLRALRFSGPGAAMLTVPHRRIEARGRIAVNALPGRRAPRRATVLGLARGSRLEVRRDPTA